MLARGFRTPSNLLVLDEPTNDLDLETLDLLQEFLAEYAGTVLLVSHDRDFLDRTCTSIIHSDGDGCWTEYAGGYSDMVAQRKGGKIASKSKSDTGAGRAEKIDGKDKNPIPNASPGTTKLSFKQQFALENLPGEIDQLSLEITKLKKVLEDPGLYAKEPKKFQKYVDALAKREAELTDKEEEWLELELLREETGK